MVIQRKLILTTCLAGNFIRDKHGTAERWTDVTL